MRILLCEQNFRDVWRRNKSVSAEIGKILRTHTHTHAAQLVVRIYKLVVIHVCLQVYMLSWIERQAASTLFAKPPTATIDEALTAFMEVSGEQTTNKKTTSQKENNNNGSCLTWLATS